MGKFLTCKPFNKRAAYNTIKKAWGLHDGVQIIEVGPNLFQFKFHTEFDLERVLKGGPWSFDNQALLLARWQKGMTAKNVKFETISLWVQIWGAPFDMVSPKMAAEMGRRLGIVEEVERKQKNEMQNLFMRVKVALPISKPIRRGGFIAGSEGGRTWVTHRYERLPIFCHYCGLLGHDVRHCAGFFAASKTGGEVDCQYGEWLKSMGAHSWSPPKSGQGRSIRRAEAEEEESYRGRKQQTQVAAEDAASADKKGNDLRNNKDGEIPVTAADSPEVNACMIKGDVTVTKLMASTCMEGNSVGPGGAEAKDVLDSNGEHGLGKTQIGPSKPRPKWTRLLRMDCGPVEETKGELVKHLGKRSVSAIMEEENANNIGMHGSKRGKTQNDLEVFAEARVLEHPCQSQ